MPRLSTVVAITTAASAGTAACLRALTTEVTRLVAVVAFCRTACQKEIKKNATKLTSVPTAVAVVVLVSAAEVGARLHAIFAVAREMV